MYKLCFAALIALASCSQKSKTAETTMEQPTTNTPEATMESSSDIIATKNFHYFTVPTLDESGTLKMSDYKGRKILIVNVASKCGYTSQYAGLQKLNEQYGDQVQVIGLPCNQFMGQEPGGKEEIAAFCSKTYGVSFPMSTKIDVKGNDQHAIYKWLTNKSENQVDDYKVGWNFNKFLIDENGKLIAHYDSRVTPMSEELIAAISK
jgi:glutathione peroxidase